MRRNRILYSVLLFMALVFVYFYGGKVPYMLFYVALILPVISIAYTVIVYVKFRYIQSIDKSTVFKGETVRFLFNIINRGVFLYPYIRLKLYSSDTVFSRDFEIRGFSLMPLAYKKHTFNLECKYRGHYKIGIKTVEIEDFLGIISFVYKPKKLFDIIVLPRIIHLESFSLKTSSTTEEHSTINNRLEDTYNISDIRRYQYGDNLKNIHWKLSAKLNNTMVKNYQSSHRTNATLFIDLKRNDILGDKSIIVEDMIIETAIAIINYCLTNWIYINIIYCDYDETMSLEGRNPAEFDEIYSILSDINFNSVMEVEDIMDIYLNNGMAKSNLIILTCRLNERLYDEISKAKLLGYDVIVVYLSHEEIAVDQKREEDVLAQLVELGVGIYTIHTDGDIKEILES